MFKEIGITVGSFVSRATARALALIQLAIKIFYFRAVLFVFAGLFWLNDFLFLLLVLLPRPYAGSSSCMYVVMPRRLQEWQAASAIIINRPIRTPNKAKKYRDLSSN